MRIIWTSEAWHDYEAWQEEDKKTVKRINKLVDDIERNGNKGIGKPEPLKYSLAGFWSRRIDDNNRLVYRLTENAIEILQCKYHYDK